MSIHNRIVAILGIVVLGVCQATGAADSLLESLPDDAICAFQINRPQHMMPREGLVSLYSLVLGDTGSGRRLAEAGMKLPGEVVIGVLPARDKKVNFHFSVAIDLKDLHTDIDELIRQGFLPALARLNRMDAAQYELDKSTAIRRIISKSSGNTVFAYTTKKDTLLGCTQPQYVNDWVAGQWPQKARTKDTGLRKALAKGSKTFAARVLINPSALGLPDAAEKPAANSEAELKHKLLPPNEIESIVGELEWEKSSLAAHINVVLGEKSEGLARVISQPTTNSMEIGAFPADFTMIGRLSLTSLQGIVDGVYSITDRFDPSISKEYREDLAGFKKETDCDWDGGILGNIKGEITFGARVDFTRNPPIAWAVIAPLADEAKFNTAFEKLVGHFGIQFEEARRSRGGIRVSKEPISFAMDMQKGRLVIADGPETIDELGKSEAGEKIASQSLRELYATLGESNQLAALVDLDLIASKTPLGMLAPDKLKKLLTGQVGITLRCHERIGQLNFRWNTKAKRTGQNQGDESQSPEDSIVTVLESGLSSIQEIRAQSQRTVSAANMRSIGQGIYIYANNNKGRFPPDMATLINAEVIPLSQFIDPYTNSWVEDVNRIDNEGPYRYRSGLSTNSDPREVLLAEKPQEGAEGANFLFVDSHVEFVPEPEASELIEKLKKGEAVIRLKEGSGR